MEVAELNLCHIPCDLSKPRQLEAALAGVGDFLKTGAPRGRVLLINNSGFGLYGSFPAPGVDQQAEMVDLNVRAMVHLTGALLPAIRERGGVIMNIASTSAFQPTPFIAVYGATKAFVLHWSLALNEELRGTGVRSMAVCPGPTSTEFFARAGLEKRSVAGRFGQTSDEVALEALRAMAAGRSLVVTGWRNKLAAALAAPMPKRFVARVAGKVIARYRMSRIGR
jgi:short-subunit dehydrogenase